MYFGLLLFVFLFFCSCCLYYLIYLKEERKEKKIEMKPLQLNSLSTCTNTIILFGLIFITGVAGICYPPKEKVKTMKIWIGVGDKMLYPLPHFHLAGWACEPGGGELKFYSPFFLFLSILPNNENINPISFTFSLSTLLNFPLTKHNLIVMYISWITLALGRIKIPSNFLGMETAPQFRTHLLGSRDK